MVSEASDRFRQLVPPALKYTDYCVINEYEAQQTTGVPLRDESDRLIPENLPKALEAMKSMGVTTWAVIHCPEGGFGLDENGALVSAGSLILPGERIVGSVGAGDAFCAGVLYGAEMAWPLGRAIGTIRPIQKEAAMSTAIFNFDGSVLLWIQNSLRGGILNPIMVFITHLGDKGLFWTVLTLALMCFRKTRKAGVTSAIAMVIGLIVANLILKNWVARIRPYELVDGLNLMIEKQHDFSFPSGHATNSFACAWVLFRELKKPYGIAALILAILIAFSRLFVGVAIGICAAEAARAIVKALKKRFPAFRDYIRPTAKKGGAKG